MLVNPLTTNLGGKGESGDTPEIPGPSVEGHLFLRGFWGLEYLDEFERITDIEKRYS